jgi:hypothetical protein
MCLIIDTDCLSRVFIGRNSEHKPFIPVMKWIRSSGYMVYGGTKYNAQLGRHSEVLGLVVELSKRGKTIRLSSHLVDPIAAELKTRFPEAAFDDEHLVALVIASKCGVVCTYDKGAMKYLRRPDVYDPYRGVTRPSIYSGSRTHHKLCCPKNIVGVCRNRADINTQGTNR